MLMDNIDSKDHLMDNYNMKSIVEADFMFWSVFPFMSDVCVSQQHTVLYTFAALTKAFDVYIRRFVSAKPDSISCRCSITH